MVKKEIPLHQKLTTTIFKIAHIFVTSLLVVDVITNE